MSFQFNWNSPPAAFAVDPDAPLYAALDGKVSPLSNGECWFQPSAARAQLLSFQLVQILDLCRPFRALASHCNEILRVLPALAAQREQLPRLLAELAQRGLLIQDREFLARIGGGSRLLPPPMSAVFIRACDRPQQLKRLLQTLLDYEQQFRAGRHYIVLDDSRDPLLAEENRGLLRDAAARTVTARFGYLGSRERAGVVERLAKGVPGRGDELRWLLQRAAGQPGYGAGRNWNLATLLSAGSRYAFFDEDHLLPLHRHPAQLSGLLLDPTANATTLFYPTIEQALGAGQPIDGDPFELHLDVCGHGIGTLLAFPHYRVDPRSLHDIALSELSHLDPATRIVSTLHGMRGGSGSESNLWLYQIGADERAAMCSDAAAYRHNREAQTIWFGRDQALLTDRLWFTPFAMDNSRMLPCVNPTGRGDDALFHALTRYCYPDSAVLDLPVTLGHLQEQARTRSDHVGVALRPRFHRYVSDLVAAEVGKHSSDDPGQRLQLLAHTLRDLAGARTSRRIAQLREYLDSARASLVERLQRQLLAAADAPAFWRQDVQAVIDNNRRALVAAAAPSLADWPDDADDAQCAQLLATELNALATGLCAWPEIWSAAIGQGPDLLREFSALS